MKPMPAVAKYSSPNAFVFTPSVADKIWSFLSGRLTNVSVNASCADQVERAFDSVAALSAYENTKVRAIRSLSFEAKSADRSIVVSIDFGPRVQMRASGDEQSVVQIRDHIRDIVDGTRPWYSFASRFSVIGFGFIAFIFASFVISSMAGDDAHRESMSFERALLAAAKVSVYLIAIFGVFIALSKLQDRFFPMAAFCIGQGAERHAVDEKFRWVVIVGFLVSIFSSLVVTFMLPGS
jgi:hypothetical protein